MYLLIENFSAGLDLRKTADTAPIGTLRELTNAHITPGGEIEKRRAFVDRFDATSQTFGAAAVEDTIYVFQRGNPSDAGPGTPAFQRTEIANGLFIEVQTLNNFNNTANLVELIDWDLFDGKIYAVVRGNDDVIRHFYDGQFIPEAKGKYIRTFGSKMYSVDGKQIYFSAVGDPTNWTDQGAGFINTAFSDADATTLLGLEVYYDRLAVFSERSIQIWNMDEDPANNSLFQQIRFIGTRASLSTRQYGAGDVLFLASNGVRSLQARDSSNSGSVSDVGSPLDPVLQQIIRERDKSYYSSAKSIMETETGRFWLALPDRIFVLSAFPGPNVTAWSEYSTTDSNGTNFDLDWLVVASGIVVLRGTNNRIYVYGGQTHIEYDSTMATAVLPYINADRPAHFKQFQGVDLAVLGAWSVDISMDPNNVAWERVATITKTTYPMGRIPVTGYSTHAALRLRSTAAEPARVAQVCAHYHLSEDS